MLTGGVEGRTADRGSGGKDGDRGVEGRTADRGSGGREY